MKNDDKLGVVIENLDQSQLAVADACDNGSLAQTLTELLFSKQEMAQGCATKPRKEGIQALDPRRLHAIRG